MDSLLEKIKAGVLWDFPGGVFPPERKSQTNSKPIKSLPLASHYLVPLKQHIGSTNNLLVKTGDSVLKGQALTACNDNMSVPVHAPTSGTIGQIASTPSAHASGLPSLTVEVIADGNDTWCELTPLRHFRSIDKAEIVQAIKQAGIAGLGGAAFPTHIKQSSNHPTDLLIINGIECEPYISADDVLMQRYAEELVHGLEVLDYLLQPKLVVIAVEDNKPAALAALDKACETKSHYVVRSIPTKYPAGGEKQLIQVITNKEIPTGTRPIDMGITTQNVGTIYAIYRAIYHGEPLIERIVTLTGDNVTEPGNYWIRLGTTIEDTLSHVTEPNIEITRVIMGGPMMGFNVHSEQVPVTKITNCLIVPSEAELPPSPPEQACIRCSACADACPASLLPQQLYWHSKAKEHDKAKAYNLFDCIECGACSYVCPSDIPLVQYYRQTKAEIRQADEECVLAEKAKERFEARNARLEREKQERLNKHKQAAEKRKQALEGDQSAKDKIAAAMARVKAKKKTTEPSDNQAEDKAAATSSQNEDAKSNVKSKAQQAIERAKAKKAAQAAEAATAQANEVNSESTQDPTNNEQTTSDNRENSALDTKAQVKSKAQQAIAHAKAKKLAQQQAGSEAANASSIDENHANQPVEQKLVSEEQNSDTPISEPTTEDTPKAEIKSKAQAAIARAKAKKQAKEQAKEQTAKSDTELDKTDEVEKPQTESDNPAQHSDAVESNTADALDTDVKAKARAAIERAKARREQLAQGETETDPAQSKQDKIKQAIAKAKAKREQQQS